MLGEVIIDQRDPNHEEHHLQGPDPLALDVKSALPFSPARSMQSMAAVLAAPPGPDIDVVTVPTGDVQMCATRGARVCVILGFVFTFWAKHLVAESRTEK